MVRLDECVEALYNKESMQDKRKTLSIIRVMKGAISVSKSRTGECIFRHNKLERDKLDRTVKKFKSDANYAISRFDTKKKFVVGRWRTMLEKQTTCNSTRLFNELLEIGESDRKSVGKDVSDNDSYFKKFLQLRLQRQEYGANGTGLTQYSNEHVVDEIDVPRTADNNELTQDEVYVTEKHGMRRRQSLMSTDILKVQQQASQQGKRPSLPRISLVRRSQTTAGKPETNEKEERPELSRDLTDWNEWRLNDKDWLLDYIKRQKTRHEDLIMRNALAKIESEMSGNNTIRRHQVRARLHRDESVESKLKQLTSRSFESPRCDTKLSRKLLESLKMDIEPSLGVRAVTEGDAMLYEAPIQLHKEMTKVRMRTLPEPLPIIFENQGSKKNTAVLPLITISKA